MSGTPRIAASTVAVPAALMRQVETAIASCERPRTTRSHSGAPKLSAASVGATTSCTCSSGIASRSSAAVSRRSGQFRSTSLCRLPGSRPSTGRAGIEAEPARQLRAVSLEAQRREPVDQRMPDERRAHAGLAQERLLEREDHGDLIGAARELAHPARAPGPDLRRDEVQHRNPAPLGDRRERQVQVRRVDEHGQVGVLGVERAAQPRVGAEHARRAAEHLGEPRDRDLGLRDDRPEARALELRAAEPEHVEIVRALAQRLDQRRGVQVARRVGRRKEDSHC